MNLHQPDRRSRLAAFRWPSPLRVLLLSLLGLVTLPVHGAFIEQAAVVGLDTAGNKDGGLLWADFNGDGFLDVLVNTADPLLGSRLYFSDGQLPDPSFIDVTATHAAGLEREVGERTALAADLNHDGLVDLVRNRNTRIEIYLNRGPLASPPYSFGDATQAPNRIVGPGDIFALNSEGIGWLDFDNDGWLDLILDDHSRVDLLRNPADGSATFQVASTVGLGLPENAGSGDYLAVTDYDLDGDIDLLDRKANTFDLYANNGDGTFTTNLSFNFTAPNTKKGSVIFCDFDDDGDFDLFWSDGGVDQIGNSPTNRIFLQDAQGNFAASTSPASPPGIDVAGVACADVDNDGDLDLFLPAKAGDLLFVNQSDGGPLAFVLDNQGITGLGDGKSAAFGDYDQDGDVDLLINQSGANELWRNTTNDRNYLMVSVLTEVVGCPAPVVRSDVGATLFLRDEAGGRLSGARELNGGKGFGSQGSPRVHFGLPLGPDRTYRVEVAFQHGRAPDALVTVRPDQLGAYQHLVILDVDPDGDGISTAQEIADTLKDPSFMDLDQDGLPAWFDADADGDGILDADEGSGGDRCAPPIDADASGVPDYLESDADHDGVRDAIDNCPQTPNPDQENLDGDAFGDACAPPSDLGLTYVPESHLGVPGEGVVFRATLENHSSRALVDLDLSAAFSRARFLAVQDADGHKIPAMRVNRLEPGATKEIRFLTLLGVGGPLATSRVTITHGIEGEGGRRTKVSDEAIVQIIGSVAPSGCECDEASATHASPWLWGLLALLFLGARRRPSVAVRASAPQKSTGG